MRICNAVVPMAEGTRPDSAEILQLAASDMPALMGSDLAGGPRFVGYTTPGEIGLQQYELSDGLRLGLYEADFPDF